MFNLEQIDANTSVWLNLDGQEYELNDFSISFNQNVDQKGEPQSRVRGGQMKITFSEIVPPNIYDWAMKSKVKNGEVTFRIESGSSPLSIVFTKAYCTNFSRNINAMGGGLSSDLIISPEEININGISFDNHWVE